MREMQLIAKANKQDRSIAQMCSTSKKAATCYRVVLSSIGCEGDSKWRPFFESGQQALASKQARTQVSTLPVPPFANKHNTATKQ